MPRFASRAKDRIIDGVWPDFREEIMWEAALLLNGRADRDEERSRDVERGACCFLAFLRYHIYPYDKSIWGKLRDPVWLLFALISAAPVMGMASISYTTLFFIIDRSEEFQLTNYILQFKGMMFFSFGMVKAWIGFFMFFSCVAVTDDDCTETGPGSGESDAAFFVVIISFLTQIVFLWLAFCLLPISQQKGRRYVSEKIIGERYDTFNGGRRGYLRKFMVYELLCFSICLAGFCVLVVVQQCALKLSLYACQVVYGILSAPFIFLILPGVRNVLTHCPATGYDQRGLCQPLKKPAKEAKPPHLREAIATEDLVQDSGVDDLLDAVLKPTSAKRTKSDPRPMSE